MVRQLDDSPKTAIVYPDSDGKPMADNTRQFRWITTIKSNLDWLFANNADVFVAGEAAALLRLRVAPRRCRATKQPRPAAWPGS